MDTTGADADAAREAREEMVQVVEAINDARTRMARLAEREREKGEIQQLFLYK